MTIEDTISDISYSHPWSQGITGQSVKLASRSPLVRSITLGSDQLTSYLVHWLYTVSLTSYFDKNHFHHSEQEQSLPSSVSLNGNYALGNNWSEIMVSREIRWLHSQCRKCNTIPMDYRLGQSQDVFTGKGVEPF